jgi:hypothetical protein
MGGLVMDLMQKIMRQALVPIPWCGNISDYNQF